MLHPNQIYYRDWDAKLQDALVFFRAVDQPLATFLDAATRAAVDGYLDGKVPYQSVLGLYHENSFNKVETKETHDFEKR